MTESFPGGGPSGGPFGGPSGGPPDGPSEPPPAPSLEADGARRRLVLVLGLAVLAVVAAAAYLLVLRGDESGEVAVPATYGPHTPAPSPSPTPRASTTPKPGRPPPAAPDQVAGRDPFQPLVVPTADASASPSAPAATGPAAAAATTGAATPGTGSEIVPR